MSKRFSGQRGSGDPGDSRAFLRKEGFELIDESDGRERWVGYYERNGRRMEAGLIRTASGDRRFYVKNPTQRFWKNAHRGQCMLDEAQTVENAYWVHWNEDPDAWVDGIRRIEHMM